MERFLNTGCDPKRMSALSLAFIGDAVFELFVRERLVCQGNQPVNKLHKSSVRQVCSHAQSEFAKLIVPILSEEESNVLKRGRNAHTNHVPKNSDVAEYHAATAFETLFGYLYLYGRFDRLRELFELICNDA